jgi:transcriptional regulator with XRE-family HTH domain
LKLRNIYDTLRLDGNDLGIIMMVSRSLFWDDLERKLENPEFLRAYVIESIRISTVDAILGQLDEVREEIGITKAELARAIGAEPASLRRLFASNAVNPTLGTLADMAAALGLRVSLEPMSVGERKQISKTLLEGCTSDAKKLVKNLERVKACAPRTRAVA